MSVAVSTYLCVNRTSLFPLRSFSFFPSVQDFIKKITWSKSLMASLVPVVFTIYKQLVPKQLILIDKLFQSATLPNFSID